MSENLLVTFHKTRIRDCFVQEGSLLDFSSVTANYRDKIIQGKPNKDFRFFAPFYKKICVDIVLETAMNYPYNFISEKTYRPIICGRPFIILGPYHSLFFLRSLGFSTFSSIIDEQYDEIQDAEKRFISACQSIVEFIDRPLDLVRKDVEQVKNILEKNQQNLKQLIQNQMTYVKKQIEID